MVSKDVHRGKFGLGVMDKVVLLRHQNVFCKEKDVRSQKNKHLSLDQSRTPGKRGDSDTARPTGLTGESTHLRP